MTEWVALKQTVIELIGLERDALHVHAGVMGQLLFALVSRRSLASPLPWLLVLLLALGNEYLDLRFEQHTPADVQHAEALKDIWNTMLLPTLLLVVARWAPGLLVGSRKAGTEESAAP